MHAADVSVVEEFHPPHWHPLAKTPRPVITRPCRLEPDETVSARPDSATTVRDNERELDRGRPESRSVSVAFEHDDQKPHRDHREVRRDHRPGPFTGPDAPGSWRRDYEPDGPRPMHSRGRGFQAPGPARFDTRADRSYPHQHTGRSEAERDTDFGPPGGRRFAEGGHRDAHTHGPMGMGRGAPRWQPSRDHPDRRVQHARQPPPPPPPPPGDSAAPPAASVERPQLRRDTEPLRTPQAPSAFAPASLLVVPNSPPPPPPPTAAAPSAAPAAHVEGAAPVHATAPVLATILAHSPKARAQSGEAAAAILALVRGGSQSDLNRPEQRASAAPVPVDLTPNTEEPHPHSDLPVPASSLGSLGLLAAAAGAGDGDSPNSPPAKSDSGAPRRLWSEYEEEEDDFIPAQNNQTTNPPPTLPLPPVSARPAAPTVFQLRRGLGREGGASPNEARDSRHQRVKPWARIDGALLEQAGNGPAADSPSRGIYGAVGQSVSLSLGGLQGRTHHPTPPAAAPVAAVGRPGAGSYESQDDVGLAPSVQRLFLAATAPTAAPQQPHVQQQPYPHPAFLQGHTHMSGQALAAMYHHHQPVPLPLPLAGHLGFEAFRHNFAHSVSVTPVDVGHYAAAFTAHTHAPPIATVPQPQQLASVRPVEPQAQAAHESAKLAVAPPTPPTADAEPESQAHTESGEGEHPDEAGGGLDDYFVGRGRRTLSEGDGEAMRFRAHAGGAAGVVRRVVQLGSYSYGTGSTESPEGEGEEEHRLGVDKQGQGDYPQRQAAVAFARRI